MAGLDGLMRHLVGEVALFGERGASPSDLCRYIDVYYANSELCTRNGEHANLDSGPSVVDRLFKEQVWHWLTLRDDIRVGPDGQGNAMSLSDVEAHNLTTQATDASTLAGEATGGEKDASEAEMRVYASDEQMWLAVAGHGPDPEKITPLEFTCLSVIAAHRERGIAQPELVKLTGQDKRSLPPRTQKLAENGYIVKKPLLSHHSRTSLLILKRFADISHALGAAHSHHEALGARDDLYLNGSDSVAANLGKYEQLEPLIRSAMQIVKHRRIVTWNDLKKELTIYDKPGESRVLAKAMRGWEHLGFVQRVRAMSSIPRVSGKPYRCLKMLREPCEADWDTFFKLPRTLKVSPNSIPAEDDADGDADEDYHIDDTTLVQSLAGIENGSGHNVLEVSPVVWTPDRPLQNIIFDVVQQAGIRGAAGIQIRENSVGPLYSKPVEHTVTRLVEYWQLSQPTHLRHLAIVRDTAQAGKTSFYKNYTHGNYQRLVDRRQAVWESVQTAKDVRDTELDEHGFPRIDDTVFQGQHCDATITECAAAVLEPQKAKTVGRYRSIQVNADGQKEINWTALQTRKGRPRTDDHGKHRPKTSKSRITPGQIGTTDAQTAQETASRKTPKSTTRGRPRKYALTATVADVATSTPAELKKWRTSVRRAKWYEQIKIEREVARRVEFGDNADQARTEVTAMFNQPKGVGDTAGIAADQQRSSDLMDLLQIESSSPGSSKKKPAPYFPSMVAHTIFKAPPPKLLSTAAASKPRLYRSRKIQSAIAYFPSRYAHTLPLPTGSKKRGKGKESGLPSSTTGRLYSTVTRSHTVSNVPSIATVISSGKLTRDTLKGKWLPQHADELPPRLRDTPPHRKWQGRSLLELAAAATEPDELNKITPDVTASASSSTTQKPPVTSQASIGLDQAATTRSTRAKKRTSKAMGNNMAPAKRQRTKSTVYDAALGLVEETSQRGLPYEEQLPQIPNASTGCFIRSCAALVPDSIDNQASSRGLIIFRLPRLHDLPWFVTDSTLHLSYTSSATGTSPVGLHKLPTYSQKPHPSSHVSPLIPGLKRKHTTSDASPSSPPSKRRSRAPEKPLDDLYVEHPPERPQSTEQIVQQYLTEDRLLGSWANRRATPPHNHLLDDSEVLASVDERSDGFTALPNVASSPNSAPYQTAPDSRRLNAPTRHDTAVHRQNVMDEIFWAPPVAAASGVIPPLIETDGDPSHMLNKPSTKISNEQPERQAKQVISEASISVLPVNVELRLAGTVTDGSVPKLPASISTEVHDNWDDDPMRKDNQMDDIPVANSSVPDNPLPMIDGEPSHEVGPGVTGSLQAVVEETATVNDDLGKLQGSTKIDGRKRKTRGEGLEVKKVTRTGGSMAAVRKNIIMDIVERCGGVYPGDKELWYPFTTIWMQRPEGAKPDQRTIMTAKKALVDVGKLRQLKFSFKTKGGAVSSKSIVTLMSVSTTDPRINTLQRDIIDSEPRLYFPEECKIAPGLSIGNSTTAAKGALDVEEQVELVHLPEPRRAKELGQATQRLRLIQEAAAARRSPKMQQQLDEADKELGEPAFIVQGYRHSPSIPSNLKDNRTTIPLYPGAGPRFGRRPRTPERMQEDPSPKYATLSHQPHTVTHIVEANGCRLTKLVAQPTPIDPYRRIEQELVELDKAANHSTSIWTRKGPRNEDFVAQHVQSANLSKFSTPHPASKPDWKRIGLAQEPKEQEPPHPRGSLSTAGPSSAAAVLGDNISRTRKHNPRRRSRMDPLCHDFGSEIALSGSLMDPHQVFHASTGTYSTNYDVLRRFTATVLPLPCSLKELLERRWPGMPIEGPTNGASPFDRFLGQLRKVEQWEEHAVRFEHRRATGWPFINHKLGDFEDNDPLRVDMQTVQSSTVQAPRRAPSRPVVKALPARRLATLTNRKRSAPPAEELEAGEKPLKKLKLRGPKASKDLGPGDDRRILIGMNIVRSLLGGVEQTIDWEVLAKMFAPRFTERFLHRTWSRIRDKFKLVSDKMTVEFQELFIQAYEDGAIPTLDYDNLDSYDWKWLLDWTAEQLDKPKDALPELPLTRSNLEQRFEIRQDETRSNADCFEAKTVVPVPRRRHVFHRDPRVISREDRPLGDASTDDYFDTAKNWIRANVITPESTYIPSAAREKLLTLGEDNIERGIRELLLAKVVMQENKGRLVPGRSYDMSENFIKNFKVNLEVAHLQQAARFKTAADDAFKEDGKMAFSEHAGEGDMIAIFNLVSHGRIKLVQKGVPMEEFGLTEGSYKTRFMDRRRLRFEIGLAPTESWQDGRPLLPLPRLPRCAPVLVDGGTDVAKLPVWIDINGDEVPVMWDLALTVVLALAAVRPGLSAQDMEGYVAPSLEAWEIQMAMEWVVKAGAARWAGKGLALGEWWWLLVGEGGNEG